MFANLARWCFRRPWLVIGAWMVILGAIMGSVVALGGPAFDNGFAVPESESADGFDILTENFGGLGAGAGGAIVFESAVGVQDPSVLRTLTGYLDELLAETAPGGHLEGLSISSPFAPTPDGSPNPQISQNGQVAYASVSIPESVDQVASAEMGMFIREAADDRGIEEAISGRMEIGGAALVEFETPESELLGLAFAVVVLIIAMGSVLAMGTTIGVALLGVAAGAGLMALLSNFIIIPEFATTIGLMIGLGVGIDYALFIVTRYREALREGFDPEGAVVVALDTAGRSVVFAGATVVVSLLGLLLIGLEFIAGLGWAASGTVLMVMLSSVTLLPAALGLVKEKIQVTRWRGMIASGLVAIALLGLGLSIPQFLIALPMALVVVAVGYLPFNSPLKKMLPPRKDVPVRETVWYRLSRTVQNRPWFWALASAAVLLVLTLPVLGLNLGFSDEGNYNEETTTRQAYDLLAEGFGPGANGPLLVVAEISSPEEFATMAALGEAIAQTEGVAFASAAFPNNLQDPASSTAAAIQIQPKSAPQDTATEELVERLRTEVIAPGVAGTNLEPKLTGATAASIDFTGFLSTRLLIFFAVVLALSFLLLMVVFRSILVPLKAVIMNMLSIGAAYGIAVAIFQWGWFGSVFGIEGAPIEPFLPMLMFAIVFGLSMDYEVFILSRMKEEFERTGDAVNSVADGISMTARVITAAAAIMVVVFGSFVFEDDRIIKLFGLGLASAVFIDATLVRMILVPATMQLLGAGNWWLPGWLERILPNLNVEGGHHEPPSRTAQHAA